MEMVKENNVKEIVIKAGMSIEEEFNLWFKENKEEIRDRLLNWNQEYEDEYYDLASEISIIATKFFLRGKDLPYDDKLDAGFGTIIHACDLFN